jgi:hypothetical protein
LANAEEDPLIVGVTRDGLALPQQKYRIVIEPLAPTLIVLNPTALAPAQL